MKNQSISETEAVGRLDGGLEKTRRVLIGGDLCPTGRVLALLTKRRSSDVFGSIREEIESAQCVIANLECPLFDGNQPIEKTGPHLRGPTAGAEEIRNAGFDVVTLANNHLRDHGGAGVMSTLGACRDAGIAVVGAGRNLEDARVPLVIDVEGFRLGLMAACENEFSVATELRAGANPIDPFRLADQISANQNRWDALIILLHSGREHYPYPTPRQRALCRWLVGLGAAAVVCQHSHCAGCFEQVGSSLIVYGQGNLLFDSPGRVPQTWFDGFVVSLELDRDRVRGFKLLPFQQTIDDVLQPGDARQRAEELLEGVNRRSEEILEEGFVEEMWNKHCAEVSSTYLLWLAGARWHDRILSRLNRLLRRQFRPFSTGAQRRYSLLLRCETHREILETVLAQGGGSDVEESQR